MGRIRIVASIGLFLLTLPGSVLAQEQPAAEQDLDAMVGVHADVPDGAGVGVADDAADVRADLLRQAEAAFLLNAEDVMQPLVRPDPLDGSAGSDNTITLKTTTIIIGLLALIVILAI